MLELKSTKKKIKINDKVFEMKAPTYKDSLEYEKNLQDAGADAVKKADCLFDYLNKLGLPKESSLELEVEHLVSIVGYLSGEKKT
jgi:hypothetical protein